MVNFNRSIVAPIFAILGMKAPAAKIVTPVTPAQAVRLYTYFKSTVTGKVTSKKPVSGEFTSIKAPSIGAAIDILA